MDYYIYFWLRVTSRFITSEWHRLDKRIKIGCTIFILFDLAINAEVKSVEVEC